MGASSLRYQGTWEDGCAGGSCSEAVPLVSVGLLASGESDGCSDRGEEVNVKARLLVLVIDCRGVFRERGIALMDNRERESSRWHHGARNNALLMVI